MKKWIMVKILCFLFFMLLPIKGLSALAKLSDYQAEEFSVDTQKLWLQMDYKY